MRISSSRLAAADYLEGMADTIGLTQHGISILELGSGVGWLGMCLSHNLPRAEEVVCTEQRSGGALQWLRHNIAQNTQLRLRSLRTCHCDWSDFTADAAAGSNNCGAQQRSAEHAITPQNAPDERWDFIVGSDLVYTDEGAQQLAAVLHRLANARTQIYYAHTKRRFENLDMLFLRALDTYGLEVEEVLEPWAPAPPASPPPFESVFPDMRLAVYKISKRMERP